MLDMGFIHDVKKLLVKLPKNRQSLFFSATMPPEIVKLAATILANPLKVTVTPVSSTVDIIKQHVFFVDKGNKMNLLLEVLKDKNIKTALVFTRTKHGADKVVRLLVKHDIKAEAIHGNKAQNARQKALNNFKAQTTRVLVATDIAARGIDVDELEYVINFEMPNPAETYVHRIGRTGRAGAKGTAFSFCDAEEKEYLRDVEKLIAKRIKVVDNHPFPLMDHNPVKEPKQQRPPRRNNQEQGKQKATASTANHNKQKPAKTSPNNASPKPSNTSQKSGFSKRMTLNKRGN
jgi:ATP-dependent RNA helicase RhlE